MAGTANSDEWTELYSALKAIVGEKGLIVDPQETAVYCEDYRHLYRGRTPAVVRPASTEQVAQVVQLCARRRMPIVPQGGNTGMMGGSTPSADGTQLVMEFSRMNRIRELDPVDMTMTVDAGVTLKAAQDAAAAKDCTVPLSMGSEGSAQMGGVFATNAGGNNTVRYGNARDFVLGLEVVLPGGQIWNGLRRLRKDNTGYCLRQLFVGSEGTLGIITGAVLKLVPRAHEVVLAFCAVPSVQAALDLFVLFRRYHHDKIQAFEYMHRAIMDLVLKNVAGTRLPLEQSYDHYALVELADVAVDSGLRQKLEDVLEKGMEAGLILDGVIAGSAAERQAVWQLRETVVEAQAREGPSIKNDVTVPVSKTPEFIMRAKAECERRFPGIRVIPYGHMGDGNIHFNLTPPIGADHEAFKKQDHEIMGTVMEVIRQFDGSFSAEHGIGQIKPYMMEKWRGGAELDTMRRIKAALDPLGIMNPGKVLP
jgi:FAD/FMN-containing dehydrogenase